VVNRAQIAAADIAIRHCTERPRALRLAKEAADCKNLPQAKAEARALTAKPG